MFAGSHELRAVWEIVAYMEQQLQNDVDGNLQMMSAQTCQAIVDILDENVASEREMSDQMSLFLTKVHSQCRME